ncbi:MAG: hypothetical protein LBJ73_04045 [Rickettsiales bacterium]|nr:hypothetical protein [Rickettsiales bacterium]
MIFTFLLVCMMPLADARAWPMITDEGIRGAWGSPGGTWNDYPWGSNHAAFCVANSKDASGGCSPKMGIHGDDQAMVGLVAWKVTANGGYFCVTQFQCEGKRSSWTWNLAPNGSQKCFWLCRNGFSGDGCLPINESEYTLSTGNAACGTTSITRTDFESNTVRTSGNTGWNQENSIDLLHSHYAGGMEMDVMVGVSGWLENKKGVVGSPLLFHCTNHADSNTMNINVYTSKAAHTLCLPGYTGANCEKCKAANMCTGYSVSQFSASMHTMSTSGGCSKFVCSDSGQGFKSATERNQCDVCNADGRYGVDGDGVCVKCSDGQVFDKTTKRCKQATTLATPEMQFGKGKNSAPQNFIDACWAKLEPAEYACCIFGKTWNTTTKLCS